VVSGPSIFLPGGAYLTLAIGNALDDTHHWFSILACMAAVAVLLDARCPVRVVWAGTLCGIATCFTQSRGAPAVSALAAFLWWEGHAQGLGHGWCMKRLAGLFAGFGAVTISFFAYFVWKAGWANFAYIEPACYSRYSRGIDKPFQGGVSSPVISRRRHRAFARRRLRRARVHASRRFGRDFKTFV
jgi:hypothetical protein